MKKLLRRLTVASVAFYLLLLTWVILFKANMNTIYFMFDPDLRGLSLIPCFNARETILNVIAFIPLGVFVSLLKFRHPILTAFSVSLFYEIMQYILAVGTADITDLITNTLGGVIGILIIQAANYLMRRYASSVPRQ